MIINLIFEFFTKYDMKKYLDKEQIETLIDLDVLPNDDFIRMNPHLVDGMTLLEKLPERVNPFGFKEYNRIIKNIGPLKRWTISYEGSKQYPNDDTLLFGIEDTEFIDVIFRTIFVLIEDYHYNLK